MVECRKRSLIDGSDTDLKPQKIAKIEPFTTGKNRADDQSYEKKPKYDEHSSETKNSNRIISLGSETYGRSSTSETGSETMSGNKTSGISPAKMGIIS